MAEDQRGNSRKAAWAALALTWLVTALLVAWGARQLRAQVREQTIGRDGEILLAIARSELRDDPSGLYAEEPLALLVAMARLEGILGARLFDAGGAFVASIPAHMRESEVPAEALGNLRTGRPFSRYYPSLVLGDEMLTANPLESLAWADGAPAVEVFVPLVLKDQGGLGAVAGFVIDGSSVAREFARFDRRLLWHASLALGAAMVITGMAIAAAFRRLERANRLLARRTEDLQQANQELAQSARVAALGAVTAHLMHGLKSPVSGLHSFVAAHAESGSPAEEAWADALAATRRMQEMISQVVRVLHEHESDLSYQVPLSELGETVVCRARPLGDERRVRVVVETGASGSVDNRTASLLSLVLSNLVQNAIEATPAGRSVRVILKDGPGLVCDVADEGAGLAPAARERLFQPQRSTKEGGSGLGLAITRQLVLALGGTIHLQSTGPNGTVFRVELPNLSASGVVRPPEPPSSLSAHG